MHAAVHAAAAVYVYTGAAMPQELESVIRVVKVLRVTWSKRSGRCSWLESTPVTGLSVDGDDEEGAGVEGIAVVEK